MRHPLSIRESTGVDNQESVQTTIVVKSKRQKDLTDIMRMIEAYPLLESRIPASILKKLK